MKLAEKKTGIRIDRSAKQLQRYLDDDAVAAALSSFRCAETDAQKFCVVLGFCSNAARRIFAEFGVSSLDSFEMFSAASLNSTPGIGRKKIMEIELLTRLFHDDARTVATERVKDGESSSSSSDLIYLQTALSTRARNVLAQMSVPLNVNALLALDIDAVGRHRGAGRKVVDELQLVRACLHQRKTGTIDGACDSDRQISNPNVRLPQACISALSSRTINALLAMGVPLTPAGICALDIGLLRNRRGVGNISVEELMKLRQDCISGAVWSCAHSLPTDFPSLAEYILAGLPAKFVDSPSWKIVLNDYMGLLNAEARQSLAEVGARLGITRERVRQMARKITLSSFSGSAGACFAPVKDFVLGVFEARGWVIPAAELAVAVDRKFGWSGTTAFSIASLMCCLGYDIEINPDGFCICDFKNHFGEKYFAFLKYVNSYAGLISGLGYEGIKDNLNNGILSSLTEDEYLIFIRRALTPYVHRSQNKNSGARQNRYLTDVKSLRAKQFFASEFGLNAGGRKKRNVTPMRQEAVFTALKKAGYRGLTLDELNDAVRKGFPECRWSKETLRGMISYADTALDDCGTKILPYSRGTVAGNKTRFSLTSFFSDPKTRGILLKAGDDVRLYMERTGFGVVSVWKIMRKYRDDLPLPLPKLGFYMMMRELKAGGLEYPRYPRIAFPGMDHCEKAFQWELFEYFSYCGRKTASFFECVSFFVDCLGLQPSIASSVAFPALGMEKPDDELSQKYELKRPTDAGKAPRVLLGTVRRDPELSLIAKPGKHAIASCYLDEDGRATTMVAYVRVFFRDLEATGCPLPDDDVACLTDSGWCRKNLKLPHSALRETSEPMMPVSGYWKETFKFGSRLFLISDGWTVKSKLHFDQLAVRIAALSGMTFSPYTLGVMQTVE